jgi:hypothetical protein
MLNANCHLPDTVAVFGPDRALMRLMQMHHLALWAQLSMDSTALSR